MLAYTWGFGLLAGVAFLSAGYYNARNKAEAAKQPPATKHA
jgi:hypothetical protein